MYIFKVHFTGRGADEAAVDRASNNGSQWCERNRWGGIRDTSGQL